MALTWTRYKQHWREATDGDRRYTIEIINGRYHTRVYDTRNLHRGAIRTAIHRRLAFAENFCEAYAITIKRTSEAPCLALT